MFVVRFLLIVVALVSCFSPIKACFRGLLVFLSISVFPRLKLALGVLTSLELVWVAGPPPGGWPPWVPRGSSARVPRRLVLVAGPPGFPEVLRPGFLVGWSWWRAPLGSPMFLGQGSSSVGPVPRPGFLVGWSLWRAPLGSPRFLGQGSSSVGPGGSRRLVLVAGPPGFPRFLGQGSSSAGPPGFLDLPRSFW